MAKVADTRYLSVGIFLTCLTGLALAAYAYHVETMKEADANYDAMCDINERISCSKVFLSEYGKGFGVVGKLLGDDHILNVPNGLSGIGFYTLAALLTLVSSTLATKVQLLLAALSNVTSVYLAYILFYVLEDLCVVCVSTYLVNAILLLLVWIKHHRLTQPRKKQGGRGGGGSRKKKN